MTGVRQYLNWSASLREHEGGELAQRTVRGAGPLAAREADRVRPRFAQGRTSTLRFELQADHPPTSAQDALEREGLGSVGIGDNAIRGDLTGSRTIGISRPNRLQELRVGVVAVTRGW